MIRAFGVALGMFSTLPGVAVDDVPRGLAGRIMGVLPLVGLLLGALSGLVFWVTASLGGLPLAAVAGIAVLAWLTGGLHLDGLADTADGLGSRREAAAAMEIMRRSDIGPMGVVALVLVLLGDVAALIGLGDPLVGAAALCVAATTGRLAVVHASLGAGARGEGFGALFAGATPVGLVVLDTVLVLAFAGVLGWWMGGWWLAVRLLAAAFAGVVAGALWRLHLVARLGGMTGDTFGSLVEVTKLVVLAAAAVTLGASVPT